MTIQEMIAVMQAAVEGKVIETAKSSEGVWRVNPAPMWDWSNYDYRVKPSPPKRVFTLADFPNGTVVRMDDCAGAEMRLVTDWRKEGIGTSRGTIPMADINNGVYKDWSFSTDSGKTWQAMTP